MAGGGTFTPGVPKIRPGNYFNFKSKKPVEVSEDEGIAVIPLIGHTYGPLKTYIDVTADNVNSLDEILGYDITDENDNMISIKEALKGCSHIKVYIIGSGGTKASGSGGGITATAKYPGTGGNNIHFSISTNISNGFDVSVYFNEELKYEYTECEKISDIAAISCPLVDFSPTTANSAENAPTAIAGVKLTNGVDCTSTNGDFTAFLDSLDHTQFDGVCFPISSSSDSEEYETLSMVFVSKIKYLRENMGKTVRGAMPYIEGINYIGIDAVANAPIVDGKQLTVYQACAFVAAIGAGSDELTNNTDKVYPGATGFDEDNMLSHEEVELGIKSGAFMFTLSEDGEVVVEYDINSLTTPSESQDESYKKNRIIRTLDAVVDRIKRDIKIAKIDGSDEGYDMLDGIGASILAYFQEKGAIKNVEAGDFLIDRNESKEDYAVSRVAIQPVDSIVKFYHYISTN